MFYVTCNDISVIYVTAQICSGLKKKLYLRAGSQRNLHFVGFFNVPVLHRHGQARIWGGGGRRGVRNHPPPLEFSKYTSQRTIFSVLSGVFLHAYFKNFRLASFACYDICLYMFCHHRSTILQIALKISRLCIVHILSTSLQNNRTPDVYPSTRQLQWMCQSTGKQRWPSG